MRLASLVLALSCVASSVSLAPLVGAQDVLVCWGDSILAGFNDTGVTTTPYGPAPFGAAIPGAHRWDATTQTWGPVTPYQNFYGTSADPVYGFAAGWRRFRGTEVYIIALALPGSDASPNHPNSTGSWHPSVPNGAFPVFSATHLQPALASLTSPEIRAILFSAGNNHWTTSFSTHIDEINLAIESHAPSSMPRLLGVKTYPGTPNDVQTLQQRQSIEAWSQSGPRRHCVETQSIPGRTGGVVDTFHLTHYGSIFLGFWAAVTEFLQL
jgi:hypothetical protein